jgi:molybdopterin-guanine dinucleotide biosynthesis protein A
MGRDKALLPHPEGGTWLERTLELLATLGAPITLLSRHPAHLALAEALAQEQTFPAGGSPPSRRMLRITALAEPPPWEGPLLALHRLMEHNPEARLLLCPVDMPNLNQEALLTLVAAADGAPGTILVAHDGLRPQPLLGLYPSSAPIRASLSEAVAGGERRLQHWLLQQHCRPVALPAEVIRNVNRPEPAEPADASQVRTATADLLAAP